MNQIFAIFSVLKEIISLIKMLMGVVEQNRIEEAAKKKERLNQALQDMKTAKTPEDILEVQKRIADNSN